MARRYPFIAVCVLAGSFTLTCLFARLLPAVLVDYPELLAGILSIVPVYILLKGIRK